MDIRVVQRAREIAAPEAIQPRHLLLAALQADADISSELRSAGIDVDAVLNRASTRELWDAADEVAVAMETERYLRSMGPDTESRRKRFEEMRVQALARGISPDDPRLTAIDPEAMAQQSARRAAVANIVGDTRGERIATRAIEMLLSAVQGRLQESAIRAPDAAAGDRIHLRAVVATLVPRVLAFPPALPCDTTAVARALLPGVAERPRSGGRFQGSVLHFEEAQIEREKTFMARHLAVAGLRTLAQAGKLPKFANCDWDVVREALGYQRMVPRDPQERWGLTRGEPAAMESVVAANEVASAAHDVTCEAVVRWSVALLAAIQQDERTRDLLGRVGLSQADIDGLRCGCSAGPSPIPKTVAATRDDEVPPARFRLLFRKEINDEGGSCLQSRHVVVAGLRCLPSLASVLAAPEVLTRLRAALRAARSDEPPDPSTQPPAFARSVLDGIKRSNVLRSFVWWPGMTHADAEAADAAISLDVALRDDALRRALSAAGLDEGAVLRAIVASARGATAIA